MSFLQTALPRKTLILTFKFLYRKKIAGTNLNSERNEISIENGTNDKSFKISIIGRNTHFGGDLEMGQSENILKAFEVELLSF